MSEKLIKDVEQKMINSINHLIDEFSTIRTGRANPSLVDKLNVEYYGTKTPLQQLATISVPDPKLLVIQPFDKTALEEIEKSVLNSDIELNLKNERIEEELENLVIVNQFYLVHHHAQAIKCLYL